MESFDIVGWIVDCEFHCDDCCRGIDTDDLDPVFARSAWYSWPVCAVCGMECHDVNLTQDGQDYYDAADAEGCDDGDD